MLTPRLPSERTVLISDGGLGSLVCAQMLGEARGRDEEGASLVYPAWWTGGEDAEVLIPEIDRASGVFAKMNGAAFVTDQAGYPEPSDGSDEVCVGTHQTRVLLDAAMMAVREGIRTVVWPIVVDEGLENRIGEISRVIDRAILSSRLVTLDAGDSGSVEVTILTPIVDLTDDQLADLARETGASVSACWWATSEHPLGVSERERWGSRDLRFSSSSGATAGV